jgi:hypothetical protein
LQAEDGTGPQAGKDFALQAESDVTNTAVPAVILISEVEGHIDFNLIFHAEALLVNDVGFEAGSALRIGGGGENDFVFRISLLGDERARQIEFSARPVRVIAEGPKIVNNFVDLRRGKGFGKRGHDLREAAIRTSIDDDRFPSAVGLGGSLVAAGEVGKGIRRLEAGDRFWSALPVRAVTGDASSIVYLRAGIELQSATGATLCKEGRGKGEEDKQRGCPQNNGGKIFLVWAHAWVPTHVRRLAFGTVPVELPNERRVREWRGRQ